MDGKRIQNYWSNEMQAMLDTYKQFQILIPAENRNGAAHNGEDGRYVETLIREYLKRYLPKDLEVLTGFILRPAVKTGLKNRSRKNEVDSHSTQLDILIYDSAKYPIFQRFGENVIVPPEGVAGIISVKKNLHENDIVHEAQALKAASKLCRCVDDNGQHLRGPFLALVSMDAFEKKEKTTEQWIFEKLEGVYSKEDDYFDDLIGYIGSFNKWSIFKRRPQDGEVGEYIFFNHSEEEAINYAAEMERYLIGMSQELDEVAFSQIFPYSHFHIFGMRIKNENEIPPNVSELLYQKIKKDVADFEAANGMVMILQEELVIVVMCAKPATDAQMIRFFEQMTAELAVLSEYILGVCSRAFDGMRLIRQYYQQDILAYADKVFYYKDLKFILADEMTEKEKIPAVKFDFFKYNKFLSMKEYGEALRLLEEYNTKALQSEIDIASLKNQIKNMVYYLLDQLDLTEEQKDAERYEYFREISMAHYEQDYKEVMRQILEKITAQIGVTQKTVDDRIPRMLAFIEKNYEQDLRLEDMAEEFNFNYHYLSAYFHQHMKEGFSDYLNEIRTAKACELLENTDLSIAQISEKVGYSEHSYFCRVFKKVTGKTPSVYRRKNHG